MGLRRREGTDDGAPKAVSAATAALGSQWERGTPGERAARGGRGEGQVDSASFLPVRVRRRSSLGLASAGRTEEDRGVRGERRKAQAFSRAIHWRMRVRRRHSGFWAPR